MDLEGKPEMTMKSGEQTQPIEIAISLISGLRVTRELFSVNCFFSLPAT